MCTEKHRALSPRRVSVFVVTLSDTREEATDTSGAAIRAALEAAGHTVAGGRIVREEAERLRRELEEILSGAGYEVVVVTGGTGIAPRDLAFDTLSGIYDRPVPGFGELFRALSYTEIGSAAMLS